MPATEAVVLPTSVRPVKYRIELHPDLERFKFRGVESIAIEVVEATPIIVLNAVELRVESASLHRDGSATTATQITFDEGRQAVTLDFGDTIAPGPATLEVSFSGELNDKLHGFYRSQYTSPDGQQRYLAATQFEATDARRAFPCWDEPAHKASFEVTLVIPSRLVAISNTPIAQEAPAGAGLKSVRFAETPVMSTYLLAFVVGDLTYTGSQYVGANGATRVGVWTTPGKT